MNEQKNKWDLIKVFLWKHWVAIFIAAVVLIPILLNWVIRWRSFFKFVGKDTDWLGFWVTYISAIASFAMVFITWFTLKQNREQITELKKQWKEQNTPKVFCSLEKDNGSLFLVLSNPTPNVATNVHVNIKSYGIKETELFSKYTTLLEKTFFTISPLQKKYIDLYISAYIEGNYSEKYIDVTVEINNKKDTYRLYLQEINLIKSTNSITNH